MKNGMPLAFRRKFGAARARRSDASTERMIMAGVTSAQIRACDNRMNLV